VSPLTKKDKAYMEHPHPNKRHVMIAMRQFILGFKRRNKSARSLVHYKDLIQTYLTAKRAVIKFHS
jgi:hypothetical protein